MISSNNFIEDYREYAVMHWKASHEGDYKTANKNYAKLTEFFELLQNSRELREETLPQLLNDSNYSVQAWVAAHCLGLKIYQDQAISILEYISEMSSREAPSFEAKMSLKVWKEKGMLTF